MKLRTVTGKLLEELYEQLYDRFGPQHWWPGETPWEVTAGAVLTQNTNWQNVEKAIANLKQADALAPQAIGELAPAALADLIRPSGYFNVKTKRLKAVAAWWRETAPRAANPTTPLGELRHSLLEVTGVGPETADSILLYAFNRPVFVVDAYTRRVLARHRLTEANASYHHLQRLFMDHLPEDTALYNEYHALIVAVGKNFCGSEPRCHGCPLAPDLPP